MMSKNLPALSQMFAGFLLGLICCFSTPFSTLACKYSVRDVAFVDLTREAFHLLMVAEASDLESLKQRIQPVTTAVFLDSNVRVTWLTQEEALEHPAFRSGPTHTAPSGAYLYQEGLNFLKLMTRNEIDTGETTAIWELLEKAVQSPVRQKALEHLMTAYAVILVVEGTDKQSNDRVTKAAQSAADALEKMIPDMPKPVDVPPQVIVLSRDQIDSEMAMLWSLGLDYKEPEHPQSCVLIGRGRRLGPTLQNDEITSGKLQQILSVAGQDCECDLDRSWMQGPMIPLRWGPDRQQTAYNTLGFDPENPLVKAEISRILARGKNPLRVNSAEEIGTELDMLLLGYSEEVIGADDSNLETPQTTMAAEIPEEINVSQQGEGYLSSNPNKSAVEAEDASVPEGDKDLNKVEDKKVDQTPASTPVRKILVILAGFCVLAFTGGVLVLAVGRSRR